MDATMTLEDFEDVYNDLDTETQRTLDSIISRSADYSELANEVLNYDGEDSKGLVRAAAALDEGEINQNEILGGLRIGRSFYEKDLKAIDRSRKGL